MKQTDAAMKTRSSAKTRVMNPQDNAISTKTNLKIAPKTVKNNIIKGGLSKTFLNYKHATAPLQIAPASPSTTVTSNL